MPSSTTAKVNEIVAPILPLVADHGHNVERGPYMKLMPAHWYEIVKRTAEHEVAPSVCYF